MSFQKQENIITYNPGKISKHFDMYTVEEWLIIARNILRQLGYDTNSLDEEINFRRFSENEAIITHKDTLQEILNEEDWGYKYSTLGDP